MKQYVKSFLPHSILVSLVAMPEVKADHLPHYS